MQQLLQRLLTVQKISKIEMEFMYTPYLVPGTSFEPPKFYCTVGTLVAHARQTQPPRAEPD
jgi:hypothetical protein